MQRVTQIVRRKEREGLPALDTITLDRQSRARRRVVMTSDSGRDFLLDLAELTYVADGDAFVLEDGHIVVRAMFEPLMEVVAEDPLELSKIAWHLGNRHTPAEITAEAIYVQPDHVLAAMIEGLGGMVRQVVRAFEPEGGAYGGHGALVHSHHHGPTHAEGAAPHKPRE